jgi:hypothetical protein
MAGEFPSLPEHPGLTIGAHSKNPQNKLDILNSIK